MILFNRFNMFNCSERNIIRKLFCLKPNALSIHREPNIVTGDMEMVETVEEVNYVFLVLRGTVSSFLCLPSPFLADLSNTWVT